MTGILLDKKYNAMNKMLKLMFGVSSLSMVSLIKHIDLKTKDNLSLYCSYLPDCSSPFVVHHLAQNKHALNYF